jgi:ligand-binding sensor domain-containing protein/signal transduction histidine kinase
MRTKFAIWVIFVWLTSFGHYHIHAQVIRFQRLGKEAGYSQNTINCIYQDHNGLLWMGTQDGLNKYDGYQFEIFRHHKEDSTSLSHSWIWDIAEDRYQQLWVATWQGLNKMDTISGKFIRFLPQSKNLSGKIGSRPTSLANDERGFLWISFWGAGLCRYDHEKNHFQDFRANNTSEGLPSDFVRKLYIDRNNQLWICTWDGLARLEYRNNEPQIAKVALRKDDTDLNNIKITCAADYGNSNLWLGTLENGIISLNTETGETEQFLHEPKSLKSNDISALYLDSRNKMWVGTTADGLHIYNEQIKGFDGFEHNEGDEQTISGNYVASIFEDNSGIIWIGANGINKYNPRQLRFSHFKHHPRDRHSLSNNRVTAFCEDHKGNIWIGTDGSLDYFNPANKTFKNIFQDNERSISLSDNNLTSIILDKNDRLLIGTGGGGLNVFNSASNEIYAIKEDPENPHTKGINYITSLTQDKNGNIWIATFDRGLIRMDNTYQRFTHFVADTSRENSLSGNYLLYLHLDSFGNLWIGTWGAGLCRYDPVNKQFTTYANRKDEPNSLSGNIVEYIYETHNEGNRYLWVGTNSGLSVARLIYPTDNLSFYNFTQKDGLPGNIVYGILEDDDRNIWVSTTNGLAKLNLSDSTFNIFDHNDGLQANEFNGGACLKLTNGHMLFGGVNGFNLFHPDSIKNLPFDAPVILTGLKVMNEERYLGNNLNSPIDLQLNYQQNFFDFDFAAIHFADPAGHRYAYSMEGVDDQWVMAEDRAYARYTNLDPGKYTFRVKASNKDGKWSPHQAQMAIEIIPPFWQTWYFRALILFVLIFIIYALHRFQVKKAVEVERLRVRIASDLHDDIGAALTRISIYSEQLQQLQQKDKIRHLAQKIGAISREVISSMSDIVWSIDARNDTVEDLLHRMHDFNFKSLSDQGIKVFFEQKGLKLKKPIPAHLRQNLYYIYKEAMNNILKHSCANKVDVGIGNKSGHFEMTIRDNGKGIDLTNSHVGNGLKNMQMRAKRIKGHVEIYNNDGALVQYTGPEL